MGRQGSRRSLVWPTLWDHTIVRAELHTAAGHVIRHISRYWYIQCPHGDGDGTVSVARCLTLRDVIDDLQVHLPHCCWEEVCSRSRRGSQVDVRPSTTIDGMR